MPELFSLSHNTAVARKSTSGASPHHAHKQLEIISSCQANKGRGTAMEQDEESSAVDLIPSSATDFLQNLRPTG